MARGDTAGAMAVLKDAATDDAPAAVWGEYGMLLAQTAPVNPLDYRQRQEAKGALERALDQDYRNPRWLFGFSLLMRKRGGMNDAKRVLGRAVGEVEDSNRDLEAEDRARIYLEHARSVEEYVADYDGYLPLSGFIPIVSPSCSMRGRFCLNFSRPKYFHEKLFQFEPPEMMRGDREEMWESFEKAFEAHPASSAAAAGLLGQLSREEMWAEFLRVAERHVAASDTSGWAHIWKGAGLFRQGDAEAAERAFKAGLARLEPAEREILNDLTDIVLKDIAELMERLDWDELGEVRRHILSISDPMRMTRENERALEHWTRVAIAELWFGDALMGRRGYDTEPGQIVMRYGRPRWIRQIAGNSIHGRSGRTVFWTYTKDQPSFIFEKNAGWRRLRHSFDTYSREHATDLKNSVPSVYRPGWLAHLPHQVVRFKGDRAAATAEVYMHAPETGEDAFQGRAGVYLMPREVGGSEFRTERGVELGGAGARQIVFRIPLEPGTYPYSAEIQSADRAFAAARRGRMVIGAFGDWLATSDLLIARAIEPRTPVVRGRGDLTITAAPDMTLGADDPIGVYFEVYGIARDEDGVGRYRVEVQLRGRRGLVGRVLSTLGNVIPGVGDDPTSLSWEREVQGDSDRIPEWFTMQIPEAEPGEYELEVTITDLIERASFASRREILIR
ncbi:MAG TPA: hypothetical protein VML95_06955 [Longimicrobiales bacterium]|nr:hypothetical protein [Longimicrobiales bacterium]